MYDIEFRRAVEPKEMEPYERGCPICRVSFEPDAVQVQVLTDGTYIGPLCPSCIEYLGQRNPAHFPTIEEFEELRKKYPEPVFDYEPPDALWERMFYHDVLIDRATRTTKLDAR